MACSRPKRSLPRQDYKKLAGVTIPRDRSGRKFHSATQDATSLSQSNDQLYHLQVIEEDPINELVKVSYVGYGSEFDEWRSVDDIVTLTEEDESSSEEEGSFDLIATLGMPARKRFCLYDELGSRIKSLLISDRRSNPVCCVTMNFDSIYFDGLVIRSVLIKSSKQSKQKCYTISALSKFNDLLGPRWYIRGLNMAGDFCYVQPETVKFQLRSSRSKCEYQMLDDGRLQKCFFDTTDQLVFRFVRGDGTSAQWHNVLKSCR